MATARAWAFTASQYTADDSFTYSVADNRGDHSNAATVAIRVRPPNQPPQAEDDQATVCSYCAEKDRQVVIDVLANDRDPDGQLDPASLRIMVSPQPGTATVKGGRIVYSVEPSYNSTDSFEYSIADDRGATDTATVRITVSNPS